MGGGGGPGPGSPRTAENFPKFSKLSAENRKKCIILVYFSKESNSSCVNFLWVSTKNAGLERIAKVFSILDENSFEKLNIFTFLIIFFLKLGPSEIISFFDIFWVSGDFTFPPCLRPWSIPQ